MSDLHTYVVLAYKESPYLEECIKSVLHQKYKSDVVIATSTPNDYIAALAEKYGLRVFINKGEKGIGNDFNFAIKCGITPLVTIAHQDDHYDHDYSRKVVDEYEKHKDALIIFTDYYEMRRGGNISKNTNLRIKRILLGLVKTRVGISSKFIKRSAIRFGNAISCPAVTFVKPNIHLEHVFSKEFLCNVDWYAWEKLSKEKGSFVFIPECLMGHRIYDESTTSEIIGDNIRTKEDLEMYRKFWPEFIAKNINRLYKNAEKSNND